MRWEMNRKVEQAELEMKRGLDIAQNRGHGTCVLESESDGPSCPAPTAWTLARLAPPALSSTGYGGKFPSLLRH